MPAGQAFTVDITHSFPARGITVGGDAKLGLDTEGGRATPSCQVVNVFAEWVPESLPTATLRAEARNLFDESHSSRSTDGLDFVDASPPLEPRRAFIVAAIAVLIRTADRPLSRRESGVARRELGAARLPPRGDPNPQDC